MVGKDEVDFSCETVINPLMLCNVETFWNKMILRDVNEKAYHTSIL